jgi:hypothetical protein
VGGIRTARPRRLEGVMAAFGAMARFLVLL